jgi:hypothetical protein
MEATAQATSSLRCYRHMALQRPMVQVVAVVAVVLAQAQRMLATAAMVLSPQVEVVVAVARLAWVMASAAMAATEAMG